MSTKIEGKANDFIKMFNYGTMNGVIEEIGIKAVDNGILGIISTDDADGGKLFHIGEYRFFKVTGDSVFGLNAYNLKKYIKTVFKGDDKLTMEVTDGSIVVKGPKDVIETARLEVEDLETYLPEPPFKVNDEWVPLFNQGKLKPTTKVVLKSDEIKNIMAKASLVDQHFFPLFFNAPDIFKYEVGTNKENRANDVIKSAGEATVEGDELSVTLSDGFPEIVSLLSGELLIFGTTDYPIWIKQDRKDMLVCFMVSPMDEDEDEEEEDEEVEEETTPETEEDDIEEED